MVSQAWVLVCSKNKVKIILNNSASEWEEGRKNEYASVVLVFSPLGHAQGYCFNISSKIGTDIYS